MSDDYSFVDKQPIIPEDGGTINGRVTDDYGNPIANMMVMSLDGPGYGDGTCTNANGEYG